MIAILLAIASTSAVPVADARSDRKTSIAEAAHALASGRLEEARLMIGRAVATGVTDFDLQKLVADYAFASGKFEEAFSGYKALANSHYEPQPVCEKAALSALKLGEFAQAKPFAECATDADKVTWRAWNARGVIADWSQDWAVAARCYARAEALAPDRPEIANNQGWSLVLQGQWGAALPHFKQAVRLSPSSKRIEDNLELTQSALSAELPKRRVGESDYGWAARLNDAGVVAQLLGQRQRAVAAFTQALYARRDWYARAAKNLEGANQP